MSSLNENKNALLLSEFDAPGKGTDLCEILVYPPNILPNSDFIIVRVGP